MQINLRSKNNQIPIFLRKLDYSNTALTQEALPNKNLIFLTKEFVNLLLLIGSNCGEF